MDALELLQLREYQLQAELRVVREAGTALIAARQERDQARALLQKLTRDAAPSATENGQTYAENIQSA